MSTTGNIFDSVNQQICDFVQRPENQQRMRGTGSYSALFRGRLFGQDMSAAVAERLNISGQASNQWKADLDRLPARIACRRHDIPEIVCARTLP